MINFAAAITNQKSVTKILDEDFFYQICQHVDAMIKGTF